MDDDQWYSDEAATFGDRLTAAREGAELSQDDLARRLGVKTATLRSWEEDLKEPRANRLATMSGMLGVSLRWLLTGEGVGVAAPTDSTGVPPEAADLVRELRDLRLSMARDTETLERIERRLRSVLGQSE
ncbi:helix-turn-helix domain-containing protein [Salipiger sp. IMCC34102]|uniref:helix-turn-helix domain-containing protein n=1 Tax=Salipiger sp. IMCC34102 TaxID=2510647 RepID=UPI00101D632D|nr:helix-turn-helix domain-containing protein [Salipiger sp. IMCC34102]RYH02312.1 helix-turn-helix domain-containing protein [Salipiger sp. IMCC34102]